MAVLVPWTEAMLRYKIVESIRKIWFRYPDRKKFLDSRRIEIPKYNKDGALSKRPTVLYECDGCKKQLKLTRSGTDKSGNRKQVIQMFVDHIKPVVPTGMTHKEMTWDDYITRMFNVENNLQLMCEDCHHEKTLQERDARKKRRRKRDTPTELVEQPAQNKLDALIGSTITPTDMSE
jgi:hypothetical protein